MKSTDARVALKLDVTPTSTGTKFKKYAQISPTENRVLTSQEIEETFASAHYGEPGSKLIKAKKSVQEPSVKNEELSLIEMLDLCDRAYSARFLGQWGAARVDEETFASALYDERGAISIRR